MRREQRLEDLPSRARCGFHGAPSQDDLWKRIGGLQDAHAETRRDSEALLGAVQTPEVVAHSMASRLLRYPRQAGAVKLLDAGCGSGRLLVAAVRVASERGLDLECVGVEKDAATARWTRGLEPDLLEASGGHLHSWDVIQADFLLGFDATAGAFDAIIANPPYVPARSMPAAFRRDLRRRFPAASRADLSALFLERMLELLRPGGHLCVIVPNKLLAADYAAGLRRQLLEETEVDEIWDLAGNGIFRGRGAYPVVLVIRRRRPRAQHRVRVLRADGGVRARWPQEVLLRLPQHVVPLELPTEALPLLQRLLSGKRLGDAVSVGCGIATSGFQRAIGRGEERILCSGDIAPFRIRRRRRFAAAEIGLTGRSRSRQQVPKIVIPGMFQHLHAAFDRRGDLLGRVYFVPIGARDERRRLLLLALLNSRLYDVLYRGLFGAVAQSGGYLRLNAPYLRRLPWPQHSETSVERGLARAIARLEVDPSSMEERAALNRGVEELFGLESSERRLLSRLQEGLHEPAGARPRAARKLPGEGARRTPSSSSHII